VGTAYQALFNLAFARRHRGAFVLRIEDTDRVRSRPEYETAILDSLRWLGLDWDEGPDVGGPHAPYRQSERLAVYRDHVDRLLADGNAYRCFCDKDRLAALRAGGTGYDRKCRDLDPGVAARRAETEPFVVRMKIPLEGTSVIHDLLRGEIRTDWTQIDDQVLQKADGYPTYHMANVVDDHLMGISHVIRGEEWINSVPKHLRLYEQLGWDPPVFCHLPLLRNPDKSKLSKRKNPTSIRYYREAGYLPEALRNFLGLMGWTMPDGEEKFTLQDMAANLDLERISLGGPVFDTDKLRWLNGRYIREDHSPESLQERLEAWGLGRDRIARIIPLVQPRLETLGDWGALTAPFFMDAVPIRSEDLAIPKKSEAETADVLQMTLWKLEGLADFTASRLEETLKELAGGLDLGLRDLTGALYVAVSGSRVWTPLYDSMEILGPDLVRARIRAAVLALGGASGKRLKKLEKDYAARFGGTES
jgi:glutamyl-tRNA synthetase